MGLLQVCLRLHHRIKLLVGRRVGVNSQVPESPMSMSKSMSSVPVSRTKLN